MEGRFAMKRILWVVTLLAPVLGFATNGGPARADEPAPPAVMRTAEAIAADRVIAGQIQSQLVSNPGLRDTSLLVTANDGVVTLTGTVPSVELRRMAVDLAQRTTGVTRVDNQLKVRAVGSTPSDPEVPLR
jgi:hyperosmotically inducible periplasmic protein